MQDIYAFAHTECKAHKPRSGFTSPPARILDHKIQPIRRADGHDAAKLVNNRSVSKIPADLSDARPKGDIESRELGSSRT